MPSIQHLVQFAYKPEVTASHRQEVASAFLALKDECKHPDTAEPYILSLVGGKDNSPEGLADGLEHAFIVTFASAADRDYYTFKDPAHQKFKDLVVPRLAKGVVIDFEEGEF